MDQQNDSFVRLPEVLRALGISRSTFYRGIKLGIYPRPTMLSIRLVGYRRKTLRDLMDRLDSMGIDSRLDR
ncbi:helix-turn-helix transcriptional regulator [Stenotrophomonas acidaminiphila]|uniref:helix-turn-helix transcriptional regulator n=1 Tax=Stenotrophomonas acidaminiphila TaxID=128780 RepID=UPI003D2F6E0C